MNAQLILNFDDHEDLRKVLQFLADIGLDKIRVTTPSTPPDPLNNPKSADAEKSAAYQEAQSLKGDVPQPVFSLDKYSVYEQ